MNTGTTDKTATQLPDVPCDENNTHDVAAQKMNNCILVVLWYQFSTNLIIILL